MLDGSQAWKQYFVFAVTGIDRMLMLEQRDVLDQDSDSNTTELTRSYYHSNALGSVMEISTAGQTEAASYRYSPYGQVAVTRGGTAQSSDPLEQSWGYTARFHDAEIGLTYFRARYQNPVTGRFLQRDPIGYMAGPSLYDYVRSSPVVWRDPHGLDRFHPAPEWRPPEGGGGRESGGAPVLPGPGYTPRPILPGPGYSPAPGYVPPPATPPIGGLRPPPISFPDDPRVGFDPETGETYLRPTSGASGDPGSRFPQPPRPSGSSPGSQPAPSPSSAPQPSPTAGAPPPPSSTTTVSPGDCQPCELEMGFPLKPNRTDPTPGHGCKGAHVHTYSWVQAPYPNCKCSMKEEITCAEDWVGPLPPAIPKGRR